MPSDPFKETHQLQKMQTLELLMAMMVVSLVFLFAISHGEDFDLVMDDMLAEAGELSNYMLSWRIPQAKFSLAALETSISVAQPRGPAKAQLVETPMRIDEQAGSTIITLDMLPGSHAIIDNESGDFTGSSVILFSGNSGAGASGLPVLRERITEARKYRIAA